MGLGFVYVGSSPGVHGMKESLSRARAFLATNYCKQGEALVIKPVVSKLMGLAVAAKYSVFRPLDDVRRHASPPLSLPPPPSHLLHPPLTAGRRQSPPERCRAPKESKVVALCDEAVWCVGYVEAQGTVGRGGMRTGERGDESRA